MRATAAIAGDCAPSPCAVSSSRDTASASWRWPMDAPNLPSAARCMAAVISAWLRWTTYPHCLGNARLLGTGRMHSLRLGADYTPTQTFNCTGECVRHACHPASQSSPGAPGRGKASFPRPEGCVVPPLDTWRAGKTPLRASERSTFRRTQMRKGPGVQSAGLA